MVQSAIQVLSALTSMDFIFRADSSSDIGTGHVMRCLTLANALNAVGHNCSFICKKHNGNINSLIRDNNFEVYELEVIEPQKKSVSDQRASQSSHYSWIGSSLDYDAKLTNEILVKRRPDWIVVDQLVLKVYVY